MRIFQSCGLAAANADAPPRWSAGWNQGNFFGEKFARENRPQAE